MFGRQIQFGPRSLLDNLQQFYVPNPGSIACYDLEEAHRQTNNTTNQNVLSDIPDKPRQPSSPVESGAGQGPADKAAYKRFNGKEQKERDATAEN